MAVNNWRIYHRWEYPAWTWWYENIWYVAPNGGYTVTKWTYEFPQWNINLNDLNEALDGIQKHRYTTEEWRWRKYLQSPLYQNIPQQTSVSIPKGILGDDLEHTYYLNNWNLNHRYTWYFYDWTPYTGEETFIYAPFNDTTSRRKINNAEKVDNRSNYANLLYNRYVFNSLTNTW